jgi:hypothetical protein
MIKTGLFIYSLQDFSEKKIPQVLHKVPNLEVCEHSYHELDAMKVGNRRPHPSWIPSLKIGNSEGHHSFKSSKSIKDVPRVDR